MTDEMSSMSVVKEAGVFVASVALAGGVAYVIWKLASSSVKKKKEKKKEEKKKEGKTCKEEKAIKEEEEVKAVEEPVVAAEAQKATESRPAGSAGTQVLVLGLNGAGKTSLLHCFSTGCLDEDMEPTQGFNAVSINREDMHIEFLEIGGKEELRPYWERYMSKALLLVFVVDSSNSELFPIAKQHLHKLLASHPSLPLMVLANKQDLPGACGITDLHDALSLSEVGDRRLFLIGTHVKKGEAELSSGVQDARDMIIQTACDGK
ncbi:ADP-ribosylation factor-like protein 9 [Scomber japonicus]|uniref:ADP-ribosylation factor-like protein 9 n=1 Tax=Scomber japonicus TaxID=13676 RepID=UPI0023057E33|nr:ADP-ribosylation factor-like protein 9 [Scomber japonicus]